MYSYREQPYSVRDYVLATLAAVVIVIVFIIIVAVVTRRRSRRYYILPMWEPGETRTCPECGEVNNTTFPKGYFINHHVVLIVMCKRCGAQIGPYRVEEKT